LPGQPSATLGGFLGRLTPARSGVGLLAFVGLTIVSGRSPAAAAEQLVSDDWQLQVTPYLWAMSLHGDVTVKGIKGDVDESFSDILPDLNFAGMGSIDARKGRLGLIVDGLISQLESKGDTGPLSIKATADFNFVDFAGYYRIGPINLDSEIGAAGPKLVVDPYLGGRYTYLNMDLNVESSGPIFGGEHRDFSGTHDWFDPLVGLRAIVQLTPQWRLTALGDIGGFGVGSDFTWDAAGLVAYGFSLFGKEAEILAGYRALYQDYSNGSGNDKFEWDMTLHGPIVGLAIHF
jgi:hypothetical protein